MIYKAFVETKIGRIGIAGGDQFLTHLFFRQDKAPGDAVEELSSWAWFQETPQRPKQPKPLPSLPPPPKPALQSANPFPNAGRNEPCPCGSSKKYKMCCLKK
jgi:hypothetical protein